ncbi:MAG: hypothetical protein Fur002_04600 [Anaerolineales bacterium]
MKKILGFLGNEIFLGTMIALLSVFTAVASYQGSMADSDQNKNEIAGMKALNDGNAEYLSANQLWTQDDNNYDNWYLNRDSAPEVAAYYEGNFTEYLTAAIERNGGDEYPMDEEYSKAIYADAIAYWDESDASFDLASQWDERGDNLQLVMLIMALGLAFAAWASLLKEDSNMRLMFSLFGIITLIAGLSVYFMLVVSHPIA